MHWSDRFGVYDLSPRDSGRQYPWLRSLNRYFFVVEAKDAVCGNNWENIGTIGCAKSAELKLFGFVTKANEKLL